MNKLKENVIRAILSMVFITMIGAAIIFFAGQPLFDIVKADFIQAVVNGQPKDIVRESTPEEIKNDTEVSKQDSVQTKYGTLSCKSIGLDVNLFFGDTEENLNYGACIYAGGSEPGSPGTTLISAHNITYFKPLEKIKENDKINIETTDKIFTYQVKNITISNDYENYTLTKSGEQKLEIYTCYPFNITGEKSDKRFFVTCSLVKEKARRNKNG